MSIFKKKCNPSFVNVADENYAKGYAAGLKQGRENAIDECIEMLEGDCFLSGTASKVLIHHFEQLKEQSNE